MFTKATPFCTAHLRSPWGFFDTAVAIGIRERPACLQLLSCFIPASHRRHLPGLVGLKGSSRGKVEGAELCLLAGFVSSLGNTTRAEDERVFIKHRLLWADSGVTPAAPPWTGEARSSKDTPQGICVDGLGHVLSIITWLQVCKIITRNH